MARYGKFKYGEEKYGVSAVEETLSWALEVDWDDDGAYSGANEALAGSMSDLAVQRGREYMISGEEEGLEMPNPGKFTATLLNDTGRYDPFNTSSPLYPNVAAGHKFRLRVKNNQTSNIHDVLTGYLTDIQPGMSGVERAFVQGVDEGKNLQEIKIVTAILTDQGIDDAIGAALTAAGWAGGSSLDSWTDQLDYWWASGEMAWQEIDKLIDSSLGKFFVAADGTAKYYSRLRMRTAVETLTEADIQMGIDTPQPWEVVRNNITLVVNTRSLQATGELWRLIDKPLVKAGQTLTIWADYEYENEKTPAINVISPVKTTDYTMNSQEGGGGTNLSDNFTVTPTKFGETCKLEITNGGGTDGFITLLKIRGDALTTTPVELNQSTGSANRYFTIDSKWLQDVNSAEDILTLLLNFLSSAQVYPRVKLRNQPVLQFTPDLFDIVRLTFPSKSIDADYALAYIEHKWLEPTGQLVETSFYFEPPSGAATGRYWVFTATVGVNTRFAG